MANKGIDGISVKAFQKMLISRIWMSGLCFFVLLSTVFEYLYNSVLYAVKLKYIVSNLFPGMYDNFWESLVRHSSDPDLDMAVTIWGIALGTGVGVLATAFYLRSKRITDGGGEGFGYLIGLCIGLISIVLFFHPFWSETDAVGHISRVVYFSGHFSFILMGSITLILSSFLTMSVLLLIKGFIGQANRGDHGR